MSYLHLNPPPPSLNALQIYLPQRPRTASGFRAGRFVTGDRGVPSALAPLVLADAD